jgi:invasion protein IalB
MTIEKRGQAVATSMFKRVFGISSAVLLITAVAHIAWAHVSAAPPTSTVKDRKEAAPPLIQEAQSKNPTAAAPAPPPSAQPAPPRSETIVYDSWTVTCHEGGTAKKTCLATLQVLDKDRRQVLLRWQIGFDKAARLTTAIDVPTGLLVTDDKTQTRSSGISIKQGVELKLGDRPVRNVAFRMCDAQRCEASTPIDDAFVKDAGTATTATATVYTADGRAVPFVMQLKGIDKALASLRR